MEYPRLLDIVVARYNEDTEWLRDMPVNSFFYLYNKGTDLPHRKDCCCATFNGTPNVGREAHTYLQHIVANYDDLSAYTAFVQGRPADHCPEYKIILKQVADKLERCDSEICDFIPLGHFCECDNNGMPQHMLPIGLTYRTLFQKPPPAIFKFIVGAQFIVSRELIRRRPLEFYKRALEMVDKDPGATMTGDNSGRTWGAHILERLWGYVFKWN